MREEIDHRSKEEEEEGSEEGDPAIEEVEAEVGLPLEEGGRQIRREGHRSGGRATDQEGGPQISREGHRALRALGLELVHLVELG